MNTIPLQIEFQFNGTATTLFPTVLQAEQELVLVDCGYAGSMPLLKEALQQQHLSLHQLTGILITHHDVDHMGGLFELKEHFPNLKVYSSTADESYIDGREKSLRLAQAENVFGTLPEAYQPGALQFQQLLQSLQPVAVDRTFTDGEEPDFLSGAKMIFTPGHMPGHLSIYIKASKTLIAADAVVYEKGGLEIANPQFTLDLPAAIQSIKKLQQLDIEKMICYHGGLVAGNIHSQLGELAARYTPA